MEDQYDNPFDRLFNGGAEIDLSWMNTLEPGLLTGESEPAADNLDFSLPENIGNVLDVTDPVMESQAPGSGSGQVSQEQFGFNGLVATQPLGNGLAQPTHPETVQSPSHSQSEDDDTTPSPLRRLNMPTTATRGQNHHDAWLHARLQEYPGEGQRQGLIRTEADFDAISERYLSLTHHKPAGLPPAGDATIPTTDKMKAHYVDRLLNAITDFSATETAGASTSEKIESVVRTKLSLVELNLLCWQVLVAAIKSQKGEARVHLWTGTNDTTWEDYASFEHRWQSICSSMKLQKLLLHSLTRGSWSQRLANAPVQEYHRKKSNKTINKQKAQQLQELRGGAGQNAGGKRKRDGQTQSPETRQKRQAVVQAPVEQRASPRVAPSQQPQPGPRTSSRQEPQQRPRVPLQDWQLPQNPALQYQQPPPLAPQNRQRSQVPLLGDWQISQNPVPQHQQPVPPAPINQQQTFDQNEFPVQQGFTHHQQEAQQQTLPDGGDSAFYNELFPRLLQGYETGDRVLL